MTIPDLSVIADNDQLLRLEAKREIPRCGIVPPKFQFAIDRHRNWIQSLDVQSGYSSFVLMDSKKSLDVWDRFFQFLTIIMATMT